MQDIKIDFVNNKLLNEYIDKKDRVIQQIIVGCRSWLGDFFLNENFGVDYDNAWGNQQIMKVSVREQIESIPGVSSINSINIRKDRDVNNRVQFIINAEIVYDNDIITISDLLIY